MWACFGTPNSCIEIERFMMLDAFHHNIKDIPGELARLILDECHVSRKYYWFTRLILDWFILHVSAWQVKKFREKYLESENDSERTPEQRQARKMQGQLSQMSLPLILSKQMVGGLEHDFPKKLGIIIPIDSYFSDGVKPPIRADFLMHFDVCEILIGICCWPWKDPWRVPAFEFMIWRRNTKEKC